MQFERMSGEDMVEPLSIRCLFFPAIHLESDSACNRRVPAWKPFGYRVVYFSSGVDTPIYRRDGTPKLGGLTTIDDQNYKHASSIIRIYTMVLNAAQWSLLAFR